MPYVPAPVIEKLCATRLVVLIYRWRSIGMFEWNGDRKQLLSVLWIFLTVNYIYCDIFSLHHAQTLQAFLTGKVGGMVLTEEFLLSFAFIMQIPMLMILLSRFLVFKLNKYVNIAAALITGSIQSYTLYMGGTLHYVFFSIFEISTAVIILYFASTWKQCDAQPTRSA
jgi:hypothetical protein